ncbi:MULTISPECIES: hypothetical protein [unclassified Sphingobacterium]
MGTVIFDLTCTADNGERFIIEVQRTSQVNHKISAIPIEK